MSELKRLTEVKKKSNEPKDSRFENTDLPRPKKLFTKKATKETGTRLRGH